MEHDGNSVNMPPHGMNTFSGVPVMYSPTWYVTRPPPPANISMHPQPLMVRPRGGGYQLRGFRNGASPTHSPMYRHQEATMMPVRLNPPGLRFHQVPPGALNMKPSSSNPPASSWVHAKPFSPRQTVSLTGDQPKVHPPSLDPSPSSPASSAASSNVNADLSKMQIADEHNGEKSEDQNDDRTTSVPRRPQVGSGRTWHSRGGAGNFNGNRMARRGRAQDVPSEERDGNQLGKYRAREQQRGPKSADEDQRKASRQPKPSFKAKEQFNVKTSNAKPSNEKPSNAKSNEKPSNEKETPSFNNWRKERFSDHHKDDVTQRDRLVESLTTGKHECMVCCDRVAVSHSVWSCGNCYHVFHLNCIRKWANSPAAIIDGKGWRCPACQNVNDQVPNRYICFCGKARDPEWNRYDTPHSCGERCGKSQPDGGCTHNCNILCHPGRCPSCQVQVTKTCPCGKTSRVVRCVQSSSLTCGQKCGKLLACGAHECAVVCHARECSPCAEIVSTVCFCGKVTRDSACSIESRHCLEKGFGCDGVCGRDLACGNHKCEMLCHEGACGPCPLLPESSVTCACGQTTVADLGDKAKLRDSCLDPIPVCGKQCSKGLPCSTADTIHCCKVSCHVGVCPPCPLVTETQCRCGLQRLQVKCSAPNTARSGLCHRRCTQKLHCGRHRCNQLCCVDTEHRCTNTCGRKLTCGLHTCQEECHRGNCHQCWNTSFEELTCYCGASVKFPPIACGTRPPECDRSCSRVHNCDHPVTHNCHNSTCPPCTFLTEKECYGKHEVRKHIPCYLEDVCCGMPCGKPLECGHKCLLTCHKEPCLKDNVRCQQPCAQSRVVCGHPCALPCHPGGDCPSSTCKSEVTVRCICGNRCEKVSCKDSLGMLRKAVAVVAAGKMRDLAAVSGQSMDISDTTSTQVSDCRLECNAECGLIDRNRRLALALQIRNPELTNKLGPPSYSDFLKDKAKSAPAYVTQVFERLTELVRTAKQSKQKNRSFSFPPSNRDNRRVIHELAEFFGCETVSYDEEPNRNVVATAFRDKSWLPSMSVMTVVERDSGQKKALKGPVQLPAVKNNTLRSEQEDAVKTKMDGPKLLTLRPKEEAKPSVDYFDYDG